MKSKTIILSGENQNKSGRGILTIYSEDDLLKCRLRLYNVEKLNKYCKLGIYHNKQVYSANLIEKNGTYTSSFVGEFNIDTDFYTAIVNTQLSNEVILAGGTYAGHFVNNNAVFEDIENTPTKTDLISPIVDKQEIIDCNNECDKCVNCIYKEYFYNNQNKNANENQNLTENIASTENTINEVEKLETANVENNQNNEVTNNENKEIMQSLKPQFDYIFANYPENKELNSLINNSRFVEMSQNNNPYSIGAIYENENIKYLCYAVKTNYNTPAPEEIGKNYQWLPLDKLDPLSDGYYLVFQDAQDFKIIEL